MPLKPLENEELPGWYRQKVDASGRIFRANGSQFWKTWSGEITFRAQGEQHELCRIECPDPRFCILSVAVQADPVMAQTVDFVADSGTGTCTVPVFFSASKGAGSPFANQQAQLGGRIIIVSGTLATVPPADGVIVSAIITPLFPWWW